MLAQARPMSELELFLCFNPGRTPWAGSGMTGGIRHDGGIEVTEGQKHGLYVHDLDDPSAGEEGWPLCARPLANGLGACGSKRARGAASARASPATTTGGARSRENAPRRVRPKGEGCPSGVASARCELTPERNV